MSEREKLLALNLACVDAWYAMTQEERNNIEYDEFHADYLAEHGAAVPVHCKDCEHCGEYENWAKRKYLGCDWIPSEIHEVDPEHYCSYGKKRL